MGTSELMPLKISPSFAFSNSPLSAETAEVVYPTPLRDSTLPLLEHNAEASLQQDLYLSSESAHTVHNGHQACNVAQCNPARYRLGLLRRERGYIPNDL